METPKSGNGLEAGFRTDPVVESLTENFEVRPPAH